MSVSTSEQLLLRQWRSLKPDQQNAALALWNSFTANQPVKDSAGACLVSVLARASTSAHRTLPRPGVNCGATSRATFSRDI